MPTRAQAKVTTDHDEIRQWAEERGARPACVRNTGDKGDIGILRLDFPGYSGGDSLQEISWQDFFDKFDERGLALLHQDSTARGQRSNFNKLVSRETAAAGGRGRSGGRTSARSRSASGRARSSASQKSSRGKKTGRKKSATRGTRTTANSNSRSSAGSRGRAKSARTSNRSASSRSRSASAKRSSSRAAGSRSRSARSRSTAVRGRSTSSRRRIEGAKRSSARSTAKKSASTGRSNSNRSRTNTRSKASNQRSNSSASRMQSRAGRSSASSRTLTDHDEIRQWAEERNANPACVRGTGRKKNDTGMIRLDFPGFSGARSLQEIEWDDWFRQFDDNNLALVVQDSTARGQRSNFNKIIGRETVRAREQGGHVSRRHPEAGRKTSSTAHISGSRAQVKSTRGSNRGARTASARGQHREQERRAA